MKSGTRAITALGFLTGILACGDQSAPLSPLDAAAGRVGPWQNPGPPDHGLAGTLTGLAGLLQVQDARLLAVADGFHPPDPGKPALFAALGVIEGAASSIAARAAELERLAGGSHPPDPGLPPNPFAPPNPCQPPNPLVPPVDPDVPPSPCLVGLLGSIGNVLEGADSRLADIEAGFADPPEPNLPAILAALANLKAAAMSLAETAAALSNELSR